MAFLNFRSKVVAPPRLVSLETHPVCKSLVVVKLVWNVDPETELCLVILFRPLRTKLVNQIALQAWHSLLGNPVYPEELHSNDSCTEAVWANWYILERN